MYNAICPWAHKHNEFRFLVIKRWCREETYRSCQCDSGRDSKSKMRCMFANWGRCLSMDLEMAYANEISTTTDRDNHATTTFTRPANSSTLCGEMINNREAWGMTTPAWEYLRFDLKGADASGDCKRKACGAKDCNDNEDGPSAVLFEYFNSPSEKYLKKISIDAYAFYSDLTCIGNAELDGRGNK